MNSAQVDKLAAALLYEGYILYPYRPSVKNRQRWTFGGIYPQSWSEEQGGTDPAVMQTQCLIVGEDVAALQVIVRFLHLCDRTVGRLTHPMDELPAEGEPEFIAVERLDVDGKQHQAWQEATERKVDLGEFKLSDLLASPLRRTFGFPEIRTVEPLREAGRQIVGLLMRRQLAVTGAVDVSAVRVKDGLTRVTIRISNLTPMEKVHEVSRDEALLRSLISTHTILGVRGGEFVSLLDPPNEHREAAAECRNIGAWPVLVGLEGQKDTILSSPIILYDYPQLAPESPGDLFDSTEIDEILTLRILTLTEEEKRAAAGVDDRARDLLARTEKLARQQLLGLHGTMRGLRPVEQEQSHG